MPPTVGTTSRLTSDSKGDMSGTNQGFVDLVGHQSMLIYIVAAIAGFIVILGIVFAVCKIKKERQRRQLQDKRKTRREKGPSRNTVTPTKQSGSETQAKGKTNERARKKSRDMKNNPKESGSTGGATGNDIIMVDSKKE